MFLVTTPAVKVHVDASFDEDNLKGTIGVVARDKKEKFIAAKDSNIALVHDVLSAEAFALKEGLLLAESLGCNRIVVSSHM